MRTRLCTIVFVLLVAALPLSAQVSLTFTNHSEEALTWCGAATGQMIIGGYPAGACNAIQADVWDSIQIHKVEGSWDTDPAGLRGAMTALCSLPAGHSWVVFRNANAASLMYSVAFWMNTNHYPVAILLGTAPHNGIATHLEHWVAVKGINTTPSPIGNPAVNLDSIVIVDQPATLSPVAVERFLTGGQWYAELQAVNKPASTYNGNFVAIIEPPTTEGKATAKALPVTGTIIPIERVIPLAQRAVETITRVVSFRDLTRMQPQQPILVNPERAAYYIVPFAAPGSAPAAAVLINAYSGDLMEAGRFAPRAMLTDKEALDTAQRFLGRDKVRAAKATPVRGESPYFPAWRVTLDGEEVLVHPNGQVRPSIRQAPE